MILKGKTLYDDRLKRWSKGEIGDLTLSSDLIARSYYFMKNEIEVIKP